MMADGVIAVGPVLPFALKYAVEAALGGNCDELVRVLEKLLERRISGIIVYGSMSKSRRAELGESDVDLLVLVDEDATGGVFGLAEDLEIDLHVHSRRKFLDDLAGSFVFAGGKAWYDVHPPELDGWLRDVDLRLTEEPNPWTKADYLRHRVWAYRLVRKIGRIGRIDPAAALLHEARLVAAIPLLHKVAQEEYTTSITNWWDQLVLEDRDLAKCISLYLENRRYPPDGIELRKLIDSIFGVDGDSAIGKY